MMEEKKKFQSRVDAIGMSAAILSVEKTVDGYCGDIHIVCANQQYKDTMGPAYYDGMPYHELVPKEPKFEDFCFRAAIRKQKMHAYVRTEALHCWTDLTMIPANGGDDRLGYCLFLFEFTQDPDVGRMSTVSPQTSQTLVSYCLRLLGAESFREGVEAVLGGLAAFARASKARILLLDRDTETVENLCEVTNEDAVGPYHEKTVLPYALVSTWEEVIGLSDGVIIQDEHDMEQLALRNPQWVASLQANDISTLVLVPLLREKKTIGYLYLINFDTKLLVQTKELVELTAFILSGEAANYQLLQRLERLSTIDDLTGIKNRNSMELTMKQLDEGEHFGTLGIVNMDLNELKQINDTLGHVAGDNVITYAAQIVKDIYGIDDLYRPGGDEFLVIMRGRPKEEYDQKLQALLTRRENDPQFNIAVGYSWTLEGERTLPEAFLIADRSMYNDKKEYYRRRPEKDRRHSD